MTQTLEQPQLATLADPVGSPLGEMLRLAGPTMLQMTSYTIMQFIDTWMLSHAIGTSAPAAAGNAGGFSFAFISFGMGTIMVVNTLVSQSFGKKEFEKTGQYLWQGVWFALAYALLMLPLILVLPRAFAFFGHPQNMIAMEVIYMRFTIAFAGFKLIQTSFSQFMMGTNRPNSVLLSSVIGVTVNAVAAYIMLFGKLGLHPMGVFGAALAQGIGTLVEMLTLVVFSLWNRANRIKFNALDMKYRPEEMRVLVRVGFGSGLQFIVEVMAWSLFANLAIGALGETAMAANAFMFRYLVCTFLPALGISSAVTALVGRYIGMGRPDLAIKRAHLGFKVALVWLILCGVGFTIFRRHAIEIFATDPEIVRLGAILMIFAAFYELFDGMYIVYYGALRGAGDTFIPAVVTAALCWSIMLGGGYVMAKYFSRFSVAGPWGIAMVYGVILGFFMYLRFVRAGWKRIHLEND